MHYTIVHRARGKKLCACLIFTFTLLLLLSCSYGSRIAVSLSQTKAVRKWYSSYKTFKWR